VYLSPHCSVSLQIPSFLLNAYIAFTRDLFTLFT